MFSYFNSRSDFYHGESWRKSVKVEKVGESGESESPKEILCMIIKHYGSSLLVKIMSGEFPIYFSSVFAVHSSQVERESVDFLLVS